jgi:hypothetical protein
MQITMKREEINQLKHDVYTLWYHAKDKKKKDTYKKMLQLIDSTIELESSMKSIKQIFSGLL